MNKKLLMTGIVLLLLVSLSALHVEIGTREGAGVFIPFNGLWNYNWSRSVYLSSELGQPLEISSISYYVDNEPVNYQMEDQKIYLRHTTDTAITSADYVNPVIDNAYELVFAGTITYDGTGWHRIYLDTNFDYNGTDNLEVMCTNHRGSNITGYPRFAKNPTLGINSSSYDNRDASFPTDSGTLAEYRAFTRFYYELEGAPSAAILDSPAMGEVAVSTPVTLEWTSGSNTDSFDVYLSSELALITTNSPSALIAEATTDTSLTVEDLEELTTYYWKVISSNNTSEHSAFSNISHFITDAGDGLVVLGNGTLVNQGLPIEPYWAYTISQTIYPQAWIDIADKRIEKIFYQYNGNSAWTEDNIQIFMTHTELNEFPSTTSWVPSDELNLVYDGPLAVEAIQGWVEIALDIPFEYNNTQNLLVAVSANSPGCFTTNDDFFCTQTTSRMSLEKHSDSINYNFDSPPIGTLRTSYPNTILAFGDIPTTPQLSVAPDSYDWAPTIMGIETNPVTFNLRNTGLGTLTINSVSLTGDAEFTLVDENEYPVDVTNNAIQITANFQPITVGDFTASIIVTDSDNNETTIPLSGSGYDATITEFPHFEDFETTANNELPTDWFSIVQSTASAYANVNTVYPYEGLKALRLTNSNDANPEHLKAVTPPLQDIGSKRVRFYGRASFTGLSIGVGTISSNTNGSAYNELAVFELTDTYQLYELDLSNAEADDSMLCFNYYGNNTSYKTIYIDNVTIEQIPDGAFAEITPTELDFGNIYLNRVGISQVNIQNRGLDDVIADFVSEDGLFTFPQEQITVSPGTIETAVINFNPVAEGAFSGSFIIETNAPNAPSTTITATANVLPALPEGLAIVGDGTLTNTGLPLHPWYRHSYSQSIYYANEIGIANQRIEKISWHYNGYLAWGPDTMRIFMGTTTKTNFTGTTDWIDINDLSEVFTGTIEVPLAEGWVETVLNIPFVYDSSENLVVAVYHSSPSWHSNNAGFYSTPTDASRSIVYYSDSNVPNLDAPQTASGLRSSYPNVHLQFGELPEGADLVVYPTDNLFEIVPVGGTSAPKTITMRSIGLQDAIIADPPIITGADADQFIISTDPNEYPLTLPSLAITTLGVSFTPTSEGTKNATLEIVDNATRVTRVVNLSGYAYADDGNDEPTGATVLTLPVEGDTYAIMPVGDVDWYKVQAMGIGDTLMVRVEAATGSNISVKSWLYGPVTNPGNIDVSSHLTNGTDIELIIPESGDYYLRVAESTVSPSPESHRKNSGCEDTRFTRDATGLYNLFVDANYNYAYNAPINLEAHNGEGFVELSWIEPDFERYLIGYKVYRDNAQLNTNLIPIGTNTFNDASVIVGTEYTYYAVGVYEDPNGQSVPSNSVTITYFNEGEPIWGDNFEEHPDFTLDLPNWIQHDVDGGSTYGISNVEFENAGEPMSYIVFNPSATTPPITDMEPYDGDKFLASFASAEGQNDDWIITPSFTLGEQTVLSFYARSFTSEHGFERFRVKMSLTGSEPADFQYTLHQGEDYLQAPTVWAPFYFNLSQLSGNTARFAIQCVSEEAFVFMVDKFRIDGTENTVDNQDGNVAPVATNLEQNYPNPFNPETTISFSLQNAGSVTVDIYNLRGQKVKTLVDEHKEAGKHSVVWNGTDDNNKSVSSGVYFYKMKSNNSTISKKMILMK